MSFHRDQVLPRISSNVSVYPIEPEANSMADWRPSLARISFRVPGDVLVLPAHNDAFHGLHARIAQLLASQNEAEEKLRKSLETPQRVIDTFDALFHRKISMADAAQLGMAGEALANLIYLVQRGEVEKHPPEMWPDDHDAMLTLMERVDASARFGEPRDESTRLIYSLAEQD